MSAKPSRITVIEAGRGIAAALVVAFHGIDLAGFRAPRLFWFGYTGVDFFFVLSGFIIWHIHSRDIDQPSRIMLYIRKRLQRIYPPYWAVMAILIPLMFAFPAYTKAYKRGLVEIIKSVLLIPQTRTPVLGISWSLVYEMLFYVLFALFILNRRAGITFLVAWLGVIGFSEYGFNNAAVNYLGNVRVLEFFLGMLVAALVARATKIDGMFLGWSGVALFFGCGLLDSFVLHAPSGEWTLMFGISAALAIFGLSMAETQKKIHAPDWLVTLGAASYSIYLVHFPVVQLFYRLTHASGLVIYCVAVTIGIAAGVVFHFAVEKRILKWLTPSSPKLPAPRDEVLTASA